MKTDAVMSMSEEEQMARRLFAEYALQRGAMKMTNAERGVTHVFRAKWWASLPLDRIVRIASALNNIEYSTQSIRAALSSMVRAKVLRSRRVVGKTYWEVHY